MSVTDLRQYVSRQLFRWSCFRQFLCHPRAENECSDVADVTGNSASDNYYWHQNVGAAPPQIFACEGYTSNPTTPMLPTLTPTYRHKMVMLRFLTKTGQVPGRGGGRYSHTLPIRVCAAQWGCDFEAPDLEWGIHFRGVF